MLIVCNLKLGVIQVKKTRLCCSITSGSLQKYVICEGQCVSQAYILPGSEDTANIRVSQKKQGILTSSAFLLHAVCNLMWKIREEKLCLAILPLSFVEKILGIRCIG